MNTRIRLMKRIIPAYAGSTSEGLGLVGGAQDHPRIRGEHGDVLPLPVRGAGSSPHTRGAQMTQASRAFARRIIPAYAGSTFAPKRTIRIAADHPRIRGEHCSAPASDSAKDRIIPAYAGSTVPEAGSIQRRTDHPRIRGEHWSRRDVFDRAKGSSPHTRGAHLEIPAIPRIAAVIIPVFLYPSPTPQEEADRSMVLLTLS